MRDGRAAPLVAMAAAETGRERGGREAAQPVHRSFGRRRGSADSGRVQDVGAPVRTYEKGVQKPSLLL